jgi:hypothetical protein
MVGNHSQIAPSVTSAEHDKDIKIDDDNDFSHKIKIDSKNSDSSFCEHVESLVEESAADGSIIRTKDIDDIEYSNNSHDLHEPATSPSLSIKNDSYILKKYPIKEDGNTETFLSCGDVDKSSSGSANYGTTLRDNFLEHEKDDDDISNLKGLDRGVSNSSDRSNESDNEGDSHPYDLYQNLVNEDKSYSKDGISQIRGPSASQEFNDDHTDPICISKVLSFENLSIKEIEFDTINEAENQAEMSGFISNKNENPDPALQERSELMRSLVSNDNTPGQRENLHSPSLSPQFLSSSPSKIYTPSSSNSPPLSVRVSPSISPSTYLHNTSVTVNPPNLISAHESTPPSPALPSPPPSHSSHKPSLLLIPSSSSPNIRGSESKNKFRESFNESSESDNRLELFDT